MIPTDIILFLAGVMVVLGVGVLIGFSLHTRSIDRRYRRLAHCVRQLNERETALGTWDYPVRVCGGCPIPRGTLIISERPSPADED